MKFYTSDLHFGHAKIIEYENRPFLTTDEMDEAYIKAWNEVVKKGDEVYVLGDFSFHKELCDSIKILRRLNGMKFLIRGNHDHNFPSHIDHIDGSFLWVRDYRVIKDGENHVVLFHYPIQVWDRKHYGSIHLYGHVHKNEGTSHPMKHDMPNSYNVGIDIWGRPVTLDEIIGGKK